MQRSIGVAPGCRYHDVRVLRPIVPVVGECRAIGPMRYRRRALGHVPAAALKICLGDHEEFTAPQRAFSASGLRTGIIYLFMRSWTPVAEKGRRRLGS